MILNQNHFIHESHSNKYHEQISNFDHDSLISWLRDTTSLFSTILPAP